MPAERLLQPSEPTGARLLCSISPSHRAILLPHDTCHSITALRPQDHHWTRSFPLASCQPQTRGLKGIFRVPDLLLMDRQPAGAVLCSHCAQEEWPPLSDEQTQN